MIKQTIKSRTLNPADYINNQTGKSLLEEKPLIVSYNEINPDVKIVTSKNYFIVDRDYLSQLDLNFTDLGRLYKMSNMLEGKYNILYNGDIPHTDTTLMLALDYSPNKYRDFIKRLKDLGIISYLATTIKGTKTPIISMNPNFSRKSKSFSSDCLSLFKLKTTVMSKEKTGTSKYITEEVLEDIKTKKELMKEYNCKTYYALKQLLGKSKIEELVNERQNTIL